MIRKQYKREAGVAEQATMEVSFETGELGVFRQQFAFPVIITAIRSRVTKALGATDAGTITGANATGASANGVITHPLSAAFGSELSVNPTTNNQVAAGSYYQVTTAKTTAGGRTHVTLEYKTLG